MNDHLLIRGLRVETRVGVTEQERAQPQGVVVNLDVATDLSLAGSTDNLKDTVDYAALISAIAALVRDGEVQLLETVADRIANKVSEISHVTGVTVEVSKEIVPVEENVDQVIVRIERQFA